MVIGHCMEFYRVLDRVCGRALDLAEAGVLESSNHAKISMSMQDRKHAKHDVYISSGVVKPARNGAPNELSCTYWCHTVSVFTAFSPNRIGECDSYCSIYSSTSCNTNWYSDCNSS